MKLVDTSVIVDHLRGNSAATALFEKWVEDEESLVASELTRFELLAGMRPDEQARLEALFSVLVWVPVAEQVSRHAGAFARDHRRSHSGIGAVDYLLAGTAKALGADLMTTNVRHFPMFDDLRSPYTDGQPPPSRESGEY